MSDCDRFRDRLYDEDARRAIAGAREAPQDLRAHIQDCAACREAWAAAHDDSTRLAGALQEPPPAVLSREAVRAMQAALPRQEESLIDWRPAIAWCVSGTALAVCGLSLLPTALPVALQASVVILSCALSLAAQVALQGLEGSSA